MTAIRGSGPALKIRAALIKPPDRPRRASAAKCLKLTERAKRLMRYYM